MATLEDLLLALRGNFISTFLASNAFNCGLVEPGMWRPPVYVPSDVRSGFEASQHLSGGASHSATFRIEESGRFLLQTEGEPEPWRRRLRLAQASA
jgi:hypothetical protein